MPSIFSKIVSGEIPAYRVAEDERFLAFLDINPLMKGHSLVIPKQETDYLLDLDDQLLADMMIFAKKVGLAIEKTVPCKRIGIVVLGLEVPHAHIHLIPMNKESDIRFDKKRVKLSPDQFQSLAGDIRQNL